MYHVAANRSRVRQRFGGGANRKKVDGKLQSSFTTQDPRHSLGTAVMAVIQRESMQASEQSGHPLLLNCVQELLGKRSGKACAVVRKSSPIAAEGGGSFARCFPPKKRVASPAFGEKLASSYVSRRDEQSVQTTPKPSCCGCTNLHSHGASACTRKFPHY